MTKASTEPTGEVPLVVLLDGNPQRKLRGFILATCCIDGRLEQFEARVEPATLPGLGVLLD